VRAAWPERRILAENAREVAGSQVLDQAAGVLYALVPVTLASGSGPYVLQATDLRTRHVRRGASYPVPGLALASGYLWVYGSPGRGGRLVLDEVSRATLGAIRSVSVPVSGTSGAAAASGLAGSVWAGEGRVLVRVSARTGAVLARATLPSGLLLTGLAAGPGGKYLYAAAQRLGPGGADILEYSAGAGRLVARSGAAPLTEAIAGAQVTGVPGGAWVSFRSGMMGQSVLLRAGSLAVVKDPAPPARGGGTVYDWTMASWAVYGGGALWVTTEDGLVACVNPATGRVRAEETVTAQQGQLAIPLAADRAAAEVDAVVSVTGGFAGIVTISPPRTCWN
jgi:hypothetical protein